MNLIIHRGAHEIGGSCVEVNSKGSSLLMDLGLPLETEPGRADPDLVPQTLTERLNNGTRFLGLLLTHAHPDHYGLAGCLPESIKRYCGKGTAALLDLAHRLRPTLDPAVNHQTFDPGRPLFIGPFKVTPFLMDHSIFDAYGFLIEAEGKSLFYTGDFRGHGRKPYTIRNLADNVSSVDVLLMEGTLLGGQEDRAAVSENELLEEFWKSFKETKGTALVSLSSTNIDRLVTIYKAARRAGRMLVVDFYQAELLERLGEFAKIPQASWDGLKVCYPQTLARRFERLGLKDILTRHRVNGLGWKKIESLKEKIVMSVRPGYEGDLSRFESLDGGIWIYSLWKGYLDKSNPWAAFKLFLEEKGVPIKYIHTSGHADLAALRLMVEALSPKKIVPIHSAKGEWFVDIFKNVFLLNDGVTMEIN